MPLSLILLRLKWQGGCSPTGDGGQVDVTGSWYNNVFNLIAPFVTVSVVLRSWIV